MNCAINTYSYEAAVFARYVDMTDVDGYGLIVKACDINATSSIGTRSWAYHISTGLCDHLYTF